MKHLSFGWQWLCSLLVSTAAAFFWTGLVQLFSTNHHYFESLFPGISSTLTTTSLFLVVVHGVLRLAPVISVNILRKLFIRGELLYLVIMIGIGYYGIKNLYPDWLQLYHNWHAGEMSFAQLKYHIVDHPYFFSWFLSTRLTVPVLTAILPTLLLEWWTIIKDKGWFRQAFVEGHGAGGKWAGLLTIKQLKTNIGWQLNNKHLILGRALFSDHPAAPIVRVPDQSHVITSALSGSGKETTVLLPNLATYEGSVVVTDLKGSLAEQTFKLRSSKKWLRKLGMSTKGRHIKGNHHACLLDPFKLTNELPRFRYNALSEVNIYDDNCVELLYAIADGCMQEQTKEPHFQDMSKALSVALMVHVLSTEPEERQTLPRVYDLLSGIIDPDLPYADPTRFDQELLPALMKNEACGGIAQGIAAKLLEMGPNERGSVLSTCYRGLAFCANPAMRWQLSYSDFKFSDFQERPSTLYLVLSDSMMSGYSRWLRIMIGLSIILLRKKPDKKETPTLFLLDEMGKLKDIKVISEGFEFLRGYNIRVWGLLQSLDQIEKNSPDRYQTMLANSTLQIFGLNNLKEAKMASELLGEHVIKVKKKNGETTFVEEQIKPLLTPAEILIKLGKNKNRCLVFPVDGYPQRLERCSFKPLRIDKKRFYEYSPFIFKGCFQNW